MEEAQKIEKIVQKFAKFFYFIECLYFMKFKWKMPYKSLQETKNNHRKYWRGFENFAKTFSPLVGENRFQ